MTDKEKEIVVNFGALSYKSQKMADVLGWDLGDVTKAMADKTSEFSQLYKQGKARADYVIDLKLFELAQKGDTRALKELKRRTG